MESNLEQLKKDYLELQGKYNLPSFDELNKDFNIEKSTENETDYLIREVRRYMGDKLQNYLRFIETILNPSNASMFIFSMVKTLSKDDKVRLSGIYKKLAKEQLDILELELIFSEEKEAEFIKNFYNVWNKVKNDLGDVMKIIKNNWDKEVVKGKNGYFG